jgi:hypothetical protein
MLAQPKKSWRIITSEKHSTVWDGDQTLFDFNFQAFGIDPNECFDRAFEKELKPGKYLRVYYAEHYSVEKPYRDQCPKDLHDSPNKLRFIARELDYEPSPWKSNSI